jgi:hypothetical protein
VTETKPADAPANPYPFPYPITAAMLKAAGACETGLKLFTKRFGDGPVIPIPELCERWALKFPWRWAAAELMAWPNPSWTAGGECQCASCSLDAILDPERAAAAANNGGILPRKEAARIEARTFARLWAGRGPRPELLALMTAGS